MTRPISVLGLGDNTVDTYRHLRMRYPGGNAVNVAANVARLGHRAAYLGCVGDDDNGRLILGALEAEGVDVSRRQIVRDPTATTIVDLVDGDRTFIHADPGARAKLRLGAADLASLDRYDVVHSSIYSYVEDAISSIAAASHVVSFDYSQRWTLDYLERMVPHTAFTFLSAPESGWKDATALARHCLDLGARIVVITRGADGAMVVSPTERHIVRPRAIEAIDTLGAGDALIARCLIGFTLGEGLRATLEAASAFAAEACGFRGGFGHGKPLPEPATPGEFERS